MIAGCHASAFHEGARTDGRSDVWTDLACIVVVPAEPGGNVGVPAGDTDADAVEAGEVSGNDAQDSAGPSDSNGNALDGNVGIADSSSR